MTAKQRPSRGITQIARIVDDTHKEAQKGYIEYKQNYIRDFAEKCKGKVPYKTYIAMLNWKVENTK